MDKPYNDIRINTNEFIRVFSIEDTDNEDYVWHRDYNDRKIRVIDGIGWQIQMDNCLPVYIHPGEEFEIPKLLYHRIIKGVTDLIIEIKES